MPKDVTTKPNRHINSNKKLRYTQEDTHFAKHFVVIHQMTIQGSPIFWRISERQYNIIIYGFNYEVSKDMVSEGMKNDPFRPSLVCAGTLSKHRKSNPLYNDLSKHCWMVKWLSGFRLSNNICQWTVGVVHQIVTAAVSCIPNRAGKKHRFFRKCL